VEQVWTDLSDIVCRIDDALSVCIC